jgi:hypothetical protein
MSNNFSLHTLLGLDPATTDSSSTASSLGTVAAAAAPRFPPVENEFGGGGVSHGAGAFYFLREAIGPL